jgi:hypothetical protein
MDTGAHTVEDSPRVVGHCGTQTTNVKPMFQSSIYVSSVGSAVQEGVSEFANTE